MKQYKTVDVDYTNCHPVIAEALKQGKHIWCKYSNISEPVLITGFTTVNSKIYPYYGLDKYGEMQPYHKDMQPLETKKKFKSAPEIIQWCIDNGWVPAENEIVIFRRHRQDYSYLPELAGLHINLIKFYAGKEYKPDEIHDMYIHPDWLEEMV